MIRAVIFDMDGTIFDTETVLLRVWEQLVEAGMIPADIFELLPGMVGKIRSAIHQDLLAHYGKDFPLEELYRTRAEMIERELDRNGVPLTPGVPQGFEALREKGLRTAIATSTSAGSVADYMRRTGLAPYFDTIVTGDRVTNGKPAPDIFLLAARELGCRPEECLVVEDSHNGVRAGAAAGMRVVMIPDVQKATEEFCRLSFRVCDTMWEVPAIVDGLNSTSEPNP